VIWALSELDGVIGKIPGTTVSFDLFETLVGIILLFRWIYYGHADVLKEKEPDAKASDSFDSWVA
jgi:hypothetical protein